MAEDSKRAREGERGREGKKRDAGRERESEREGRERSKVSVQTSDGSFVVTGEVVWHDDSQ